MNWERYHWRHYFGGVAFSLIITQLLTGIFLTLFYEPNLKEAYNSVKYLYNKFPFGSLIRDGHRWIAMFLLIAVVIHSFRSLLRKDYLNPGGKTLWLTGSLFLLLLLAFLATGVILPWEWRAYWFMEMIPNYMGTVPIVGPALQELLIEAFTMNRAFVAHVVILPIIAIILSDYHILSKTRKRKGGLLRYLMRHSLLTIPFFIGIAVLVDVLPMPTQDPEMIPMPLEGTFIPTPEWFLLIFWVPYMHFKGFMAPLLGFYLPFLVFLALTMLPFYLKRKPEEKTAVPKKYAKLIMTLSLAALMIGLFGFVYKVTYRSPTLGCNSCHNVAMGTRMGIPPKAFKDRNIVPLLEDDEWMVKHWFIPQRMW
jgi:hypothetical protein